jgi:carboxymethylenebutenolidase
MDKQTVDITTQDGVADAYLVRPDGAGPRPAVLLFQDAFGLRPRLHEMADRIAEQGYVVLVPNLFYRAGRAPLFDLSGLGDAEKRGQMFEAIGPLMKELTAEVITRDTGAYLDFLDGLPEVAAGGEAIVGYCMGGRSALTVMAAYPERIKVLGSFHAGHVVTDAPDSPHRGIVNITGEVYFGHADNDGSMTAENIAVLEKTLDDAGVAYTSELYEGSPHGWTMADTAMYHEPGEKRHWEALFALLERTLPTS